MGTRTELWVQDQNYGYKNRTMGTRTELWVPNQNYGYKNRTVGTGPELWVQEKNNQYRGRFLNSEDLSRIKSSPPPPQLPGPGES